jgi:CBS domain-containing protein
LIPPARGADLDRGPSRLAPLRNRSMPTLRELMTPEVLTLDPEMTLREAIERLASEGFSGAPVVAGGRLVGVVSASDILEFEAASPGVPAHRPEQAELGEWGPPELWMDDMTDPPSAYFRDMWGDSGSDVLERMRESRGPEWDLLAEHVVAEVMTRKVVGLEPESSLVAGAQAMASSGIHRVLVIEDGLLLGIVTAMDVVRAVAEGKIG